MSQQYPTNGSYSYGGAPRGGGAGLYNASSPPAHGAVGAADGGGATLRRRQMEGHEGMYASPGYNNNGGSSRRTTKGGGAASPSNHNAVVRNLDFMFPKVDTEFTVKTETGGMASLVAFILASLLILADVVSWYSSNLSTKEHISVDTRLGQQLQVNLNITFPALACEDIHVDVMDVAGDSQLDLDETFMRTRLNLKGVPIVGAAAESVRSNLGRQKQVEKDRVLQEALPEDYCGPCYGAHETEGQCCNSCDELLEAYEKKRWRKDLIVVTSEQCIREGRDKVEPKRIKKGEGCNLAGYLRVNRVAGNFHIAMGEGVERDGHHIHTFNPEDMENFNSSHIIHRLSFGPSGTTVGFGNYRQSNTLEGVSKIVTRELGTTGLFQYFIKVVPTTFVKNSRNRVDTNAYYFTERFRPLMKEYIEEEHYEADGTLTVQAGHAAKHKTDHHSVRNAVLPGVFFIYEIYPFSVEIERDRVPFTHLLIRIMATLGGVFTIVRWADSFFYSRGKPKR